MVDMVDMEFDLVVDLMNKYCESDLINDTVKKSIQEMLNDFQLLSEDKEVESPVLTESKVAAVDELNMQLAEINIDEDLIKVWDAFGVLVFNWNQNLGCDDLLSRKSIAFINILGLYKQSRDSLDCLKEMNKNQSILSNYAYTAVEVKKEYIKEYDKEDSENE
jgi:hypothetical protein